MDKAYRIPNNPNATETPASLTPTVPINKMAVHSVFVTPEPGDAMTLVKKFNWKDWRWIRPWDLKGRSFDRWRDKLE